MTTRAKTVEEVRNEFLDCIRSIANFWADVSGKTSQEMCNGLAFSILALLDGCNVGYPAMDISLSPHVSDKEYYQKNGDDWYEIRPPMQFNENKYGVYVPSSATSSNMHDSGYLAMFLSTAMRVDDSSTAYDHSKITMFINQVAI